MNWESRFWKYVVKSDGCWSWTGFRNGYGYGMLMVREGDGKYYPRRAHRLSWELVNGPIPESLCVCHKCDNPPCTNPEHLFLGTLKDNAVDMAIKGRAGRTKGTAIHNAKLDPDKVREIRRMYDNGATKNELAKKFGVGRPAILNVLTRKLWKHV